MQVAVLEFVIGCVIGVIAGFLLAYLKQKGKNLALLEDNKRLTEEREKIKSQHKIEIEKVKSEYKIEIEKRKYKYEAKQEQYFKYFNLLDSFSKKQTHDFQESFFPLFKKFSSDLLKINADKESQLQTFNDFTFEFTKLLQKWNEDYLKIKSETNSVKLIAGEKVLKELSKLEAINEIIFNLTSETFKSYVTPKGLNESILNEGQSEVIKYSNLAAETHKKLMEEVKQELNEI